MLIGSICISVHYIVNIDMLHPITDLGGLAFQLQMLVPEWQILIAETVNRWPMTPVLPSPAGHLSPGNHEKHNFCKTVKTVVKLRVLEFRGTTCILEYMSMGVVWLKRSNHLRKKWPILFVNRMTMRERKRGREELVKKQIWDKLVFLIKSEAR